MELIYILTYDCNFCCKYCDVYKSDNTISEELIKQSHFFLEKNNFEINKVKIFGWEPLLKKNLIKQIVNNFPKKYKPNFFITTNSTLIDKDFIIYSKKNNIKLTFSIDWDFDANKDNRILNNNTNLSNLIIKNTKKHSNFIRINQVITSQNSKDFFKNFKFIYDLWVRDFNFLPEYYKEWTKIWLKNLKKWFDQILEFYRKWNKINLINLENYSNISFFNLWVVIDYDWKVYFSNLILYKVFEKYKEDLLIWDIWSWLFFNILDEKFKLDYIDKLNKIIEIEYSKWILNSVKYVDLILNNFCNEFKAYRN